jgi:hypothetical protein
MSKKETWRTRLYWQIVGGFLIEEFHATKLDSAAGITRRLIDGVIIDAKENGNQAGGTKDIEGKDVISVQTKGTKLSMSLLGQALFSRDLLEMHKPRSIQSVAICASGDALLEEIAKKYGVKVVIIPDAYKNNDELISELKRDIT